MFKTMRLLLHPIRWGLRKCIVAPRVITASKWAIDLGSTNCRTCKAVVQDSLDVFYDHGSKSVVIHYNVGCSGGENRYEDSPGEAIEWLKHTRRLWYEYEHVFDSIIDSLSKHIEQ